MSDRPEGPRAMTVASTASSQMLRTSRAGHRFSLWTAISESEARRQDHAQPRYRIETGANVRLICRRLLQLRKGEALGAHRVSIALPFRSVSVSKWLLSRLSSFGDLTTLAKPSGSTIGNVRDRRPCIHWRI